MKQTAVEFLIDNFRYYYSTKWNNILEQAKKIEKQQIIDACQSTDNTDFWVRYSSYEQYYDETYENKKNI